MSSVSGASSGESVNGAQSRSQQLPARKTVASRFRNFKSRLVSVFSHSKQKPDNTIQRLLQDRRSGSIVDSRKTEHVVNPHSDTKRKSRLNADFETLKRHFPCVSPDEILDALKKYPSIDIDRAVQFGDLYPAGKNIDQIAAFADVNGDFSSIDISTIENEVESGKGREVVLGRNGSAICPFACAVHLLNDLLEREQELNFLRRELKKMLGEKGLEIDKTSGIDPMKKVVELLERGDRTMVGFLAYVRENVKTMGGSNIDTIAGLYVATDKSLVEDLVDEVRTQKGIQPFDKLYESSAINEALGKIEKAHAKNATVKGFTEYLQENRAENGARFVFSRAVENYIESLNG
ncbi:MAG: hypothetical protein RIE06_33770 [Roseibium album]|uniref:hypothetical protein n=1 Tax=Roseibium album TaxID=311410 RepID=UPI0032F01ED7